MRKTSLVLAVLLAAAGICVMLWPVFAGNRLRSSTATAVQEFLADRDEPEQQYPELLAELQAYNQRILIFLCRMLLSNLFNAQKQQMRYCYAMKAAVSNGIQQMVHRNLKIRFQNAALLILASL